MQPASIITLTLNPAIDHILTVDELHPYDKNIVTDSETFLGGKGINVTFALGKLGSPCIATGFMGSAELAAFTQKLQVVSVAARFITVAGSTRAAIKVMDVQRGKDTEFNQPGFLVGTDEINALKHLLEEILPGAGWLALSGSLPQGAPQELYAELISLAHQCGVKTCLDASGEALTLGLIAQPSLLRVNLTELSETARDPFIDLHGIKMAMRDLLQGGIKQVIVSLGRQGVIATDGRQFCQVRVPPVQVVSLTGAGDTLTAGCLHTFSQGMDFVESVRFASALATSSTLQKEPGDFLTSDLNTFLEMTTAEQV